MAKRKLAEAQAHAKAEKYLYELPDTLRINTLRIMKESALPNQWINCDVREMNFKVFHNQVDVIMADPPWDIHMELPYGTLTDEEMQVLFIAIGNES